MSEGIPLRLMQTRKHLGLNAAEMADRVGLKDRKSWERYERDESSPKADVLSRLSSLGFDVNWVLTGEGQMLKGAAAPISHGSEKPLTTIDKSLMQQIASAIETVWREENARLPPQLLVLHSTRVYADLMSTYETGGERQIGLKVMLQQLRRELREAPSGSDESKRMA